MRGVFNTRLSRILVILAVCLLAAFYRSASSGVAAAGQHTTPLFAEQELFSAGQHGYCCYRIPALAVSPKGTVLAFCEARKNNCDDGDVIDIVMRRSFDNGRTWDAMKVVRGEGTNSINQPTPVVDRITGTVSLIFCRNNQKVFITRSSDEGERWTQPVEITTQVKDPSWQYLGSGPGHAIQLKSGRLLIPAWADTSPGPVTWPSANWGKVQFSYTFYSDDHGITWNRGRPLESDMSDECQVVETSPGTVYMNMRSRRGKHQRAYAWSKDGGVTWSKVAFDPNLPEPSCQGSVIQFPMPADSGNHRILLLHPASSQQRARLTAQVSDKEWRSWPVSKLIHKGPSGYSDLAIAADRTILCLYEADQQFAGRNPFEGGTRDDLAKLQKDPDYMSGINKSVRLVLTRFNSAWIMGDTDQP